MVDTLGAIQLLFEKPWGNQDICLGLADTSGNLWRPLLSQRPHLDFPNGTRHLSLHSQISPFLARTCLTEFSQHTFPGFRSPNTCSGFSFIGSLISTEQRFCCCLLPSSFQVTTGLMSVCLMKISRAGERVYLT